MSKKTVFSFLIAILLLSGCEKQVFKPMSRTAFLMDTVVKISVYQASVSEEFCQAAMDSTFSLLKQIEKKVSMHIDGSDVSRVNDNAGISGVPCSNETMEIIQTALNMADQSQGIFDPTVGVLKTLWNFEGDNPSVPPLDEIQSDLALVNYQNVICSHDTVQLNKTGMQLDLGGLAKGYIIDRAMYTLKKMGITAGIVDAGGDLRTWGRKSDRSQWKVGIRHPRSENMDLIGVIESDAKSIATSGDYERYFFENGKRYHHLIDPRTGFPADTCVSVTIVTETSMLADAYATMLFIMGPHAGIRFIEQVPDVEALIIYQEDDSLKHVMTRGMKQKVEWL